MSPVGPNSIRFIVPFLMALMAVGVGLSSAILSWLEESAALSSQMEHRAASIGNLVVPRIERSMSREPSPGVLAELANVAVAPGVKRAFVCNDRDILVSSSVAEWEGLDLRSTASAEAVKIFARARTSQITQSQRSADGEILRTAFPFPMAALPHEIRPSRTAILCIEMDLGAALADMRSRIMRRLTVVMLVMTLLCGAVWIFLDRRLVRRVTALVDATHAAARGETINLPWAKGDDELGRIGFALQDMSSALGRTMTELRHSEARLRVVADNLPDSMVYQTARRPDGPMRFLHVSAGVERLHGLRAEEVLRDPEILYAQVLPEDRPGLAEAEAESARTMGRFNAQIRIRRADGTVRWMELMSQPRAGADQEIIWDGIATDITARREAEETIRRTNRALRTLSRTNHTLVHATTEPALLLEICRTIVQEGGYLAAWVGYAENGEDQTVRLAAQAGAAEAYITGLKLSWKDTPNGRGPTGTAIRNGRTTICRNFATEPSMAPWRDAAIRHGIQSSVSFPMRIQMKIIGSLTIYASEPDSFDEGELNLLQELADDLAYGIDHIRTNEARRLAEAERENLARAIDAHYDAAYWIDTSNRITYANASACRASGFSREELLGMPVQNIAPRASPERMEMIWRQLRTQGILQSEGIHRRKDGTDFPVEIVSILIRSGNEEIICGFARDITARKLAQRSLAEMAERLALALHASQFGVWRHQLATGAIEWDARMFAIFGLPPAAFAPPLESLLASVVAEDREAVRRFLTQQPAGGGSRLRFRLEAAGGSQRHIELHGLLHENEDGRAECIIGVAGDVTEIVQTATDTERLRNQLQQSQKMEALGNLAAGVAHDFNNILTGINGFMDLASTTLAPGHEAVDLLMQARRGAMGARNLVRRILNFSRKSDEGERLRLETSDVIRDIAPLLSAALPSNVSLLLSLSPEPMPILANRGQLEQVLMNLCTNGAHAIGKNSGRIEITAKPVVLSADDAAATVPACRAGSYIELAVRDNGCGMTAEVLGRIFEPFFTTKRAGEGTGLGVPIVHDIAVAHGGGIRIESQPEIGTNFILYLPVDAPPGSAAPALDFSGAQARVLIVDDDESISTLLCHALLKHNIRAETYASPGEAWTHFAAQPLAYNLLIVDLNMPDIDGRDFIRRTRELSPGLRTILTSGRFDRSIANDPEGVVRLQKPFELPDLLQQVRLQLARPKPQA